MKITGHKLLPLDKPWKGRKGFLASLRLCTAASVTEQAGQVVCPHCETNLIAIQHRMAIGDDSHSWTGLAHHMVLAHRAKPPTAFVDLINSVAETLDLSDTLRGETAATTKWLREVFNQYPKDIRVVPTTRKISGYHGTMMVIEILDEGLDPEFCPLGDKAETVMHLDDRLYTARFRRCTGAGQSWHEVQVWEVGPVSDSNPLSWHTKKWCAPIYADVAVPPNSFQGYTR